MGTMAATAPPLRLCASTPFCAPYLYGIRYRVLIGGALGTLLLSESPSARQSEWTAPAVHMWGLDKYTAHTAPAVLLVSVRRASRLGRRTTSSRSRPQARPVR